MSSKNKKKFLIIGSGAREHAIAKALKRSSQSIELFIWGSYKNPGLLILATDYYIGSLENIPAILKFAQEKQIEIAIVGPELPLTAGVADILTQAGIFVIGPTQALARLESSKDFMRNILSNMGLMRETIQHRYFNINNYNHNNIIEYIKLLNNNYAIKADGLMGGKGVKLSGIDFADSNHADALNYCQFLRNNQQNFIIEEKVYGEEFSLITFTDGKECIHAPLIRDHKRAFNNNTGPNTGGMGCYSYSNHKMPFLMQQDIDRAQKINEEILIFLKSFLKQDYIGFLYGGFIAVANGIRILEYNVRLGDPEAISILGLLNIDFIELCEAMCHQKLAEFKNKNIFKSKSTFCRYLVPEGYPDCPLTNQQLKINNINNLDYNNLYFGSVEIDDNNNLYTLGSRAIALLGIAETIPQAVTKVDQFMPGIEAIGSKLIYREDIGTIENLNTPIEHMRLLRK